MEMQGNGTGRQDDEEIVSRKLKIRNQQGDERQGRCYFICKF